MEKRTPPNAEGDFYVIADTCLACMAPEYEAPELMGYDDDFGCYFRRQPVNDEERSHAVRAVLVSCVEALRYGGNDPEITKRISLCNRLV